MSTALTPVFRKLLTHDLATREAGRHLLAAMDIFDPQLAAQRAFLCGGFSDVNHLLALNIRSLGGMAGEW